MTRLRFVIAFTSDVEQMKRFYRDLVGLRIASESPFFVEFESDGAALSLLAVRPGQKREIELCFETPDVERDTAALRGPRRRQGRGFPRGRSLVLDRDRQLP